LTIQKAPNVLTIQLKRFKTSFFGESKINKHIEFPEILNLTPYMSKDQRSQEVLYTLYAVLVHNGYSTRSGHYYSYIRNSNNTWYCMNDANVQQVGINSVLKQEAYILFYNRKQSNNPITVEPQEISITRTEEPKLKKLKQEHIREETNIIALNDTKFHNNKSETDTIRKTTEKESNLNLPPSTLKRERSLEKINATGDWEINELTNIDKDKNNTNNTSTEIKEFYTKNKSETNTIMAFKSITKKEYNGIGSVVIDDIAIETEKLSTNINNLLEKSIETVAINHKARLQGKLDWEREIERPKYINNLQYGITVNGWDKLGDEQKEQQKILEKAGLTKIK